MRFVSFNTRHCEHFVSGRIDFDAVAQVILDLGADVVGLNEIRGEGPHPDYTAQTEALAERTGMPYFYFAEALQLPHGRYGNAILSRIPILHAETVMIPDPITPRVKSRTYETRCVLRAELEGGITVLVTHFGLNPDEKENAAATVLSQLTERRCVLMGDFNVLPDSTVLEDIRARMRDSADVCSQPLLSFPSNRPDRKIDYLFVSPDVRVCDAAVPQIVVSDHCPYVATLDFA